MTSPSSAAADGSLITKVASLGPPLLGASLLTPLYTRMATTTLSSSRFGASVTLRGAQSPCALCRGDRAGLVRKESPRGWRPRRAFWLDALSRRGPSPRVFPWRESPGLESLVLSGISEGLCGPWQAGPWYPGFHCADSSPRAHDGHAEVVDGGEASRAQKTPARAATRGV